jgi:hypothetical protein
MPRVKKSDAVASTPASAPAPAVSAPTPAVESAPVVEKKVNANRKTFKPLSEEHKAKLAEHSKTASKSHIASMRANLLLGKSWDDSHAKAMEAEKKRATKSA